VKNRSIERNGSRCLSVNKANTGSHSFERVIWGLLGNGNFPAEISNIRSRRRATQNFLKNGKEVVQGADGTEGRSLIRASCSSGHSQQKRTLDHFEWNLSLVEL
jgi:hypothetical protein